jgi:hypothetical protein
MGYRGGVYSVFCLLVCDIVQSGRQRLRKQLFSFSGFIINVRTGGFRENVEYTVAKLHGVKGQKDVKWV